MKSEPGRIHRETRLTFKNHPESNLTNNCEKIAKTKYFKKV